MEFIKAFVHSAWAYAIVPAAVALAAVVTLVNSAVHRRKIEREVGALQKERQSTVVAWYQPRTGDVVRYRKPSADNRIQVTDILVPAVAVFMVVIGVVVLAVLTASSVVVLRELLGPPTP